MKSHLSFLAVGFILLGTVGVYAAPSSGPMSVSTIPNALPTLKFAAMTKKMKPDFCDYGSYWTCRVFCDEKGGQCLPCSFGSYECVVKRR